MTEIRHVQRVVLSSDDPAVPITLTYPSPLQPHELEDLKELFDIFVRQQARVRAAPTVNAHHE